MLSRVANLMYWTARYLERAENTARLIDVNGQLVLDLEGHDGDESRAWEPLVFVPGNDREFHALHGGTVTEQAVVEFLIFDRRNPGAIMSCLAQARENARCIRDQIATEVWESINTTYLALKNDDYEDYLEAGATAYLARIKGRIQRFYGVAESMLPRDQGWWWFKLGRLLERTDNVSRILDVKYFMLLPDRHHVGSAYDMIQWASVLRSCSAFEAFRRTRRGQLTLPRVLDYLLRDRQFPRSLLHAAAGVEHALGLIAQPAPALADNPAKREATALRRHLEDSDVTAIIASGLHEFLDEVQQRVIAIHDGVQRTFITHEFTPARRAR
jgi:uncharacterized alpha-E superfamily protein